MRVLILFLASFVSLFEAYSGEIIIKKLSANIYNELQYQGNGGDILLSSVQGNELKYLNLKFLLQVKLREGEELDLDKSNTFLEDRQGNKYECIQRCFPNDISGSYNSFYADFDDEDTEDLFLYNLAFRVPAKQRNFRFKIGNVKRMIKAKVHTERKTRPISSYATFKLLKTEVLESVSSNEFVGKVEGEDIRLNHILTAPQGNKIVAITFEFTPQKAFHVGSTKEFLMPRFSICSSDFQGLCLGVMESGNLDSSPRIRAYLRDGKWGKQEVTAIFSVPKSINEFYLTAFAMPFLKGSLK